MPKAQASPCAHSAPLVIRCAQRVLPILRSPDQLEGTRCFLQRGQDHLASLAATSQSEGTLDGRDVSEIRATIPASVASHPSSVAHREVRPPLTRSGSPVREIRSPGSVRGAARKGRPYRDSAFACGRGARTERDEANSTNSSALFGAGEPASAEFARQKIWGELSVNARSTKICVRGRSVWAGSSDHEASRVEGDFGLKNIAVGALRARKSA